MANVVTNTGREIISGSVIQVGSGPGHSVPKYMTWGTGTSTALVTDTAMTTEDYSTTQTGGNACRVLATMSQVTTSVTNDTVQAVGTLTAAADAPTIAECGLFDTIGTSAGPTTPPSGGNMFTHSNFTGVALSAGDAIQFTIQVQFS